jgi:ribosomal protein S18 acetylase RimI-like enzyme
MMHDDLDIVRFDPGDKEQMTLITQIHTAVLPDSFVVQMGETFMKKFYYKTLPQIGYLNCFLAKYQGRYVGMIVTNIKPFSLIRSAIPRNFFRVSWVMTFSLLLRPARIKVLLDLMKYKPDPLLKKFEDSGTAFEILTIGVLEQYRNVVLKNNIKISHALLNHAVRFYQGRNYSRITGQILKSNKGALGFYAKYKANYIQSSVRDFGVILDLNIKNILKTADT